MYDIALDEFDERTHRRLDINHRIMGSFEPFIEEESVKFGEFWWLVGESASLQFAIFRRTLHRTDHLGRSIFSRASETLEFVPKNLFIEGDIVSGNDIRTIEYTQNRINSTIHIGLIFYVLVIDAVYL